MSNTNISTYATCIDCDDSCWSTAAGTGEGCTGCDSLCTAMCQSSCTNTCETVCADDCRVTCAGECGKTCEGTCSGFCRDDCTGCGATCAVNCGVGCGGECSTGCGGECGGSCGAGCGAECSWGCGTDCSGECSGSCKFSCSGTSASTNAILSLEGGRKKFGWELSNLTSPFSGELIPFTSSTCICAGITSDTLTVGDKSSISGIICQVNAQTSVVNLSGIQNYPPGTYTFYGFVQLNVNRLYYPAGIATVTIKGDGSFSWTYAGIDIDTGAKIIGEQKIAGLGCYVSATEWNDLIDCVNQQKGTSLNYVSKGDVITASTVNLVANALGVAPVNTDDPIRANFFNNLMSSINTIMII